MPFKNRKKCLELLPAVLKEKIENLAKRPLLIFEKIRTYKEVIIGRVID